MSRQDQPALSSTSRRDFLENVRRGDLRRGIVKRHFRPGVCGREQHDQSGAGGLRRARHRRSGKCPEHQGPTKLWAMADVFDNRLQTSLQALSKQFEKQVDVPKERQFVGMDGYKKAIDSLDPGGVVVLATPPAFRPIHFEYAVQKGINVFMEKSFAVDAPGIRRVLHAGQEAAKKNLKIAGGLMSRHYKPLEEAVQQIHDGAIGEVVTCWAYRVHDPVGFTPKADGMSELAHQIRNYSNFTWLNGSFLLDWLIHNLDVCCWVKNAWPVSAQGQGGRQVRTRARSVVRPLFGRVLLCRRHAAMAQGRHVNGCWGFSAT